MSEPSTPARGESDRATVLVVDDDPTVREVVRRYLVRDGHRVLEAADGADALVLAARENPDLIVLDLMLPGVDGLDVCRHLRRTSTVPIVMLTALGAESDRVVGLEYGADDYVVKPFSPRELSLRVGRILDRSQAVRIEQAVPQAICDGDLVVDPRSRTAQRAGVPLALTTREFDLLVHLLRHPGQAFTRTALLEQVWDWSFGDQSTVTVHVRRLREKIEVDPSRPRRIVTLWGIGYRFDPERPTP